MIPRESYFQKDKKKGQRSIGVNLKTRWKGGEHSKKWQEITYLENGETERAVLGTRAERSAAGRWQLMPGDKHRLAHLHRAEKNAKLQLVYKHLCLSFLNQVDSWKETQTYWSWKWMRLGFVIKNCSRSISFVTQSLKSYLEREGRVSGRSSVLWWYVSIK